MFNQIYPHGQPARGGSGNGCVYRVQFTATDSTCASRAGEVTTCGPHDGWMGVRTMERRPPPMFDRGFSRHPARRIPPESGCVGRYHRASKSLNKVTLLAFFIEEMIISSHEQSKRCGCASGGSEEHLGALSSVCEHIRKVEDQAGAMAALTPRRVHHRAARHAVCQDVRQAPPRRRLECPHRGRHRAVLVDGLVPSRSSGRRFRATVGAESSDRRRLEGACVSVPGRCEAIRHPELRCSTAPGGGTPQGSGHCAAFRHRRASEEGHSTSTTRHPRLCQAARRRSDRLLFKGDRSRTQRESAHRQYRLVISAAVVVFGALGALVAKDWRDIWAPALVRRPPWRLQRTRERGTVF